MDRERSGHKQKWQIKGPIATEAGKDVQTPGTLSPLDSHSRLGWTLWLDSFRVPFSHCYVSIYMSPVLQLPLNHVSSLPLKGAGFTLCP